MPHTTGYFDAFAVPAPELGEVRSLASHRDDGETHLDDRKSHRDDGQPLAMMAQCVPIIFLLTIRADRRGLSIESLNQGASYPLWNILSMALKFPGDASICYHAPKKSIEP